MGEAKKRGSFEERKKQALHNQRMPLYRFFEHEHHAQALMEGKIWVGTLKKCREFECPQQGDSYEATSIYRPSLNISNRIVTEEDYETAKHFRIVGFLPPPGYHYPGTLIINESSLMDEIPNGYLLCTTNDPDSIKQESEKWKYGVRINLHPNKLFEIISNGFLKKDINISNCKHDKAIYDDSKRIYSDYRLAPDHLAFIKPEKHAAQSEYRFFWEAEHKHFYEDGIELNCPELKPYLERV